MAATPSTLNMLNRRFSSLCGRAAGVARKFSADRAGAVILLFGLTLIPMLGFVGGAIDYANAYRNRSKLQNALDSAALTAGRALDQGDSTSDAKTAATKAMEANLGAGFPNYTVNFDIDTTTKTVLATANMEVGTFILGVIGIDSFPLGTSATVKLASGKVEVVMVLDNSGSMDGSKLKALKKAAKDLTDTLYGAATIPDYVKVGLVPFAPSVNVGTEYDDAPWMDTTGKSSIHTENIKDTLTRWTLLDRMDDTSWGGCVEVRPAPYDTDDLPTDASVGDSHFVPTFAPDEPDDEWDDYNNSYLDDDDGSCKKDPKTEIQAQERACKYRDEEPDDGSGPNEGPNYMCASRALTPLTANQSIVDNAIDDMTARGATNIMEGVMWGWRVLSPGEPFDQGRDYDDDDNRKIMIIMTDGANTHTGMSTQNMSRYSAFGYAKNGRLRSPTSSSSALREAMNEKTSEACANVKQEKILVYTIAFDIDDDDTLELLEGCASSPSRAFDIDDDDGLTAVFQAIAGEINKLRITS